MAENTLFPLDLYRADTYSQAFTVKQSGAAFNLTGYKLKFIAKKHRISKDPSIEKEITVEAPETGVGVLALAHADLDIEAGEYICKIILYKEDDSFIRTIDAGKLTVADY